MIKKLQSQIQFHSHEHYTPTNYENDYTRYPPITTNLK